MEIVFEDEAILVIDKPSGVHSVDLPRGGGVSVARWLREHRAELSAASEKPEDMGLVHRLDFDTSGLLVAAKSRAIWETLRQSLSAGRIEKRYLAVVDGYPLGTQRITGWIGSAARAAKKVRVFSSPPPRKFRVLPADTLFEFSGHSETLGSSLVTATVPTARRHQIRAHAAAWGFPLTGDALYGSARALPPDIFGARAFFLHAFQLRFPHPRTGLPTELLAPLGMHIARLFCR